MLRVFKNVQNSIKNMMSAQEAFEKIDPTRRGLDGEEVRLGFITIWTF
jgi:hypothetical protein